MNQRIPRIIVYSTPSCPHCSAAKRYFRQLGIKFYDADVAKNKTAAKEMMKKSGQQGVPVIDIGGKIVVGFNKSKIDAILRLRK